MFYEVWKHFFEYRYEKVSDLFLKKFQEDDFFDGIVRAICRVYSSNRNLFVRNRSLCVYLGRFLPWVQALEPQLFESNQLVETFLSWHNCELCEHSETKFVTTWFVATKVVFKFLRLSLTVEWTVQQKSVIVVVVDGDVYD